MSRSLKVLLINLLLVIATPIQTLHAPTTMPTGDSYPAHSDRGNFAEDAVWHPGVGDSADSFLPIQLPPDIHPFHEEELESRRVLLINQPDPATNGVYTVSTEEARATERELNRQAILNAQTATIQRDIDSDFLQRVNELTRNLPPTPGFTGMPELTADPSDVLGPPPVDRRPSITSYRGRWDAANTYNRGDLVVLNDNTAWVACEQNFGIEPNSWRDMHMWDFISQEGPARTGQWRLDRVMEQINAQQRVGDPSMFEQPKCPWCKIRGCNDPHHPEHIQAVHQIAERGGF